MVVLPPMTRLPDRPARRVRELREAKGWSQVDLAKRSGVSKQSISKIEDLDTDHVGRFSTLLALAEALGVHVSNLFGGADHGPQNRLPVAAEVDAKGALLGPAVATALLRIGRNYAKPSEWIEAGEADTGWFAARVSSETPLLATLDTTLQVSHDLRPGDTLVLRPIADGEVITPGRIVWVTRAEDESELRVWRELDRRNWLWPFDNTEQRPEPADGWTVRAALFEQRRRS